MQSSSRTSQDTFLFDPVRRNFIRPGKAHKKHDVILNALGINWELNRSVFHKSETLAQLLKASDEDMKTYRSGNNNKLLESLVNSSRFSNSTDEELQTSDESIHIELGSSVESDLITENPGITEICLDINDPIITQKGLAIALSHLYHDHTNVKVQDVASTFASAAFLRFNSLLKGCEEIMFNSVNHKTVGKFHKVASQYNNESLVVACESWLELNVIPELSKHIELSEIGPELLDKVLNSNRLFTWDELSVYKTLSVWLFLKLNPQVRMMPTYTTVITFFNSLPKHCPLLETESGMSFLPLFSTIRFQGIMNSNDIQDIILMNILPSQWIVDMLSQQHKSLYKGGDMVGLRAFPKAAIRHGIIVKDAKSYSEVISLYGFYFELKVIKQEYGASGYIIYFQRLKPNDSAVSLAHHDRSPFSMRKEREVKYSISVQYLVGSVQHIHTTGVHAMTFGFSEKTNRSKVLSVEAPPEIPAHVILAVLLPPT